MSVLNEVLGCLERAQGFLSTYENWCPEGSEGPKRCAIVAVGHETGKLLGRDLLEILASYKTPCSYLVDASQSLYEGASVVGINDGFEHPAKGKTDRERYQMVMAMYAKAIELVKADIEKEKSHATG